MTVYCSENYFVNHLQVNICSLSDILQDSKQRPLEEKKFRRLLLDGFPRWRKW